jgi:hypothetical protein
MKVIILALLALTAVGCASNTLSARSLEYRLSDAEGHFARAWVAGEPESGRCSYWGNCQRDAAVAHTRVGARVGDFRRLRLWTQAKRVEACKPPVEQGRVVIVSH